MNYESGAGHALGFENKIGAGFRLFKIVGMSPDNYKRSFLRMNLLETKEWDFCKATERAWHLHNHVFPNRTVVCLGQEVWRAFKFEAANWFEVVRRDTSTYTLVPHPSGKNLYYNDLKNVKAVRKFLKRMARNGK